MRPCPSHGHSAQMRPPILAVSGAPFENNQAPSIIDQSQPFLASSCSSYQHSGMLKIAAVRHRHHNKMAIFARILTFWALLNTPDIGISIDHNLRMERDRNKRFVPLERYRIDARYIREAYESFSPWFSVIGRLERFFFFFNFFLQTKIIPN